MMPMIPFSLIGDLINQNYTVSGNILGKQSASYFILTDEHLIKYLSVVNHIAVTAILLTSCLTENM